MGLREKEITFLKINYQYTISEGNTIHSGVNIVVLALDHNNKKKAIKRINNSNYREREYTYLNKCSNIKGIIKIENHIEKFNYHYLVFKFYKKTLIDAINIINNQEKSGEITKEDLFFIKQKWTRQLFKICKNLEAINILHRDLKPGNIVMSKKDIRRADLILIDFGSSTDNIDQSIHGFCTEEYCAPEVFVQEKNNSKSDVWSFGQIIFELYTGCRVNYKNSDEKNLNEINKLCENKDLIHLLSRCLVKIKYRASFLELSDLNFFKKTATLNNNDPYKEIKLKFGEAAKIFLLLKNKKPKILRKIWVESIHHPVISCARLYYNKEFEILRQNYSSQVPENINKQIEIKIHQYALRGEDVPNKHCLENLISLYEQVNQSDILLRNQEEDKYDILPISQEEDENERELFEVLKKILNSF